ncbi:PHD finger protein Alfin1 [Camellia lanceoleosa]|uniref:PHD finger protein Alfin1 n=1 Tax=Camellia lanceoleosa TaxID=1840588 RepID=A0ACC0IA66_9ERIC|nr:PHD finger protein Alfin1 [Camellia lanceoleosa]
MQEKDWLSLVAVHSDSWLLSGCLLFWCTLWVWKRLFQLINDLPTIFEAVTGNVRQPKDQSGSHSNSSKIKSSGKMQQQARQPEPQPKAVKTSPSPKLEDESGGDEE